MEEAPKIGLLSIVGTPIGNLSDITLRAIEALKKADIIACEDTRESIKLIRHLQIDHKPLVSLHQHNEAGRSEQLLENLLKGQNVAVVSDAGMPMVSDPGQRFLQRCLEAKVPYEVIPGPSAVTTAAAGCGFPCDEFYFGGFLPNKSGQRDSRLQAAIDANYASIFFESPHRLMKSLAVLAEKQPDRLICVGRELTKKFEDFRRGTAADVLKHYETHTLKGEITIVVSGAKLPKWVHGTPKLPTENYQL